MTIFLVYIIGLVISELFFLVLSYFWPKTRDKWIGEAPDVLLIICWPGALFGILLKLAFIVCILPFYGLYELNAYVNEKGKGRRKARFQENIRNKNKWGRIVGLL